MRSVLLACLMLPLLGCQCSVSFGLGATADTPALLEAPSPSVLPPQPSPPTAAPTGPPRSSRVSGGPATVRGDVPAKKAGEIIARHHNELRFCHESEQATPDQVQVQLKFIISPNGDVQTASIDQSNAQSDTFDRCIAAAARRWTFPAPKGGGVAVVGYPVQLARDL